MIIIIIIIIIITNIFTNITKKSSLWQFDDLAGHKAKLAILVKHRVQVFNPLWINLRVCD